MSRWLFPVTGLAVALTLAPLSADDAADHAKAKAVVEKAILAAGWEKDTTTAARTWKDKGKFSGGGMTSEYAGEWAFAGPDKYHFTLTMTVGEQKLEFAVIANGDKAWESGLGMSRAVEGEKLDYVKGEVYQMWVLSLVPLVKHEKFHLKPLPEIKIGDAAAVGVEVTRKGKPTVKLYFDAKTDLLVKAAMTVKNEFDGWKDVVDETFLGGWTDAGGGRKAFTTMKVVRGGTTMIETELSETKVLDKIDPKRFAIPDEK